VEERHFARLRVTVLQTEWFSTRGICEVLVGRVRAAKSVVRQSGTCLLGDHGAVGGLSIPFSHCEVFSPSPDGGPPGAGCSTPPRFTATGCCSFSTSSPGGLFVRSVCTSGGAGASSPLALDSPLGSCSTGPAVAPAKLPAGLPLGESDGPLPPSLRQTDQTASPGHTNRPAGHPRRPGSVAPDKFRRRRRPSTSH
jgi:hypothetical protein